jgi:hypothetical protein
MRDPPLPLKKRDILALKRLLCRLFRHRLPKPNAPQK